MSRTFLQDLAKVKGKRPERSEVQEERPKVNPPREDREDRENKEDSEVKYQDGRKNRNMLWVVAALAVVFLFFALSYLFSSVTVTIIPKYKEVVLNENLSATKDTNTDNVLPFHLMEISGEETTTIKTTEEKNMTEKAKGLIVIFNAFNSAPQHLDISTRLEGSNGKIYKTEKAVVVPGMAGSTPGSVEVYVDGADAGSAYNSDPLDFKIFGFKGTAKYAGFYGRSKGPISGGLEGKFPFVSDADKSSAENELKATLQTKIFKKAADQIPDGFILFKDAVFLQTDPSVVDLASAKDGEVPMKLAGKLYGLLFDENKLTQKIAGDSISKYDGSDVFIPNIKDLTFSLAKKDNVSFTDVTDINFTISGNAKIVWKLDTDKLVTDLLGKSKSDFNQILLHYPNVDSAQLVISPFWKMSFPDKSKDIKVVVNYPK